MSEASRFGAIIGIGNQKGGVGKITNTVNIACALGEKGYECLIVDLDASAGATIHLGVSETAFAGSLELILDPEISPPDLAITEGLPKGVSLIPARRQLALIEKELGKFDHPADLLVEPLAALKPHYDFIFCDTPPQPAAPTTVAAYAAVEWFLLSAFPHFLSIRGISEAFADIASVRKQKNPSLEVLGVVICNVDDRTSSGKELDRALAENIPGREFQTIISQAIDVSRMPEKGRTIFQVPKFKTHKVRVQYEHLADEIAYRIRNRDQFLAGELPPFLLHADNEHEDLGQVKETVNE